MTPNDPPNGIEDCSHVFEIFAKKDVTPLPGLRARPWYEKVGVGGLARYARWIVLHTWRGRTREMR